ncbi:hypothetical protein O9X98_15480 [Agrobacterium salinitolerans]|nr:hypothetical protein [Agrobacterium salinitolerans]
MVHTPENLKIIEDRFIAPYRDHLALSGYDEMRQRSDGDTLIGLSFPMGYAADLKANVTAPLHEMGHFITLDDARCVRSGFGFRGGTPYVSCGEFWRLPTGPWSATAEGKAIAWEIIVLRDLFGMEPNYYDSCRALSHSTDFLKYEGGNDRERITWVAEKVRNWVAEFGSLADFESAWHARCERLPELLARETARIAATSRPPTSEDVYEHDIDGDIWTFTVYTHGEGMDEQFVVDIACTAAEGRSEYEQFDRKDQALGWIDRTVELALESSNTPTSSASPAP